MGGKISHEEFMSRVMLSSSLSVASDYVNMRSNMLIKCECGHTFERQARALVEKGHNVSCPRCKQSKRFLEQHFKEECLMREDIVLLSNFADCNKPVYFYYEECGHVFRRKPITVLNSNTCAECERLALLKENIERCIQLTDTSYELMECSYSNKNALFFHYECGNFFECTPDNFYKGNRCPKCSRSKGEKCISDFLAEIGVGYVQEKTFKGLGRKRFDFYLPSYNACIEYDGQLHFEAVDHFGGADALEKQQRSDNIKNVYCMINDIPLLRIPYWDYDKIPELIKLFLNEKETKL